MTILTLEGPSSVGKTTTAKAFCETESAVRVPEVNERFDITQNDSTTWYYERQCDRWRRAVELEEEYEVVILDGDVFQPLWYNWSIRSLPEDERTLDPFASMETISDFYRRTLSDREIGFPDRYYVLTADERTLRHRKANDETRARNNFEAHVRIADAQRAYWNYLQSQSPDRLRFVQATSVAETRTRLSCDDLPGADHAHRWSVELLEALLHWLDETAPVSS